jgi:hypothetical protein
VIDQDRFVTEEESQVLGYALLVCLGRACDVHERLGYR